MHGDLKVESHPHVRSLANWRKEGAARIGEADLVARSRFEGSAWSVNWGGFSMVRVEVSPHLLTRSDAHTQGSPHDRIALTLQLRGHTELIQGGRTAELLPGDVTIWDPDRPSAIISHDRIACISAMVPKSSIAIGADVLTQLTGVKLPAGDPVADIAHRSVRLVQESFAGLPPIARNQVMHTVSDMISALCLRLGDQHGILPLSRNADFFDAVLQHAEDNLADPCLSPEKIANSLFVSVRSVYRLAAERGISIASWIRTRRLERCRTDLADPSLRSLSIAAIAARWGMPHAPHFSTAFRTEFGVTPSEYRRMHLPDDDDAIRKEGPGRASAPRKA